MAIPWWLSGGQPQMTGDNGDPVDPLGGGGPGPSGGTVQVPQSQGYYYVDPNGLGSWWVAPGETPETAKFNPANSPTPLGITPVDQTPATPQSLQGNVSLGGNASIPAPTSTYPNTNVQYSPPVAQPTTAGNTTDPNAAAAAAQANLTDPLSLAQAGIPQINQITIPQAPTISNSFTPQTNQQWWDVGNAGRSTLDQIYANGQFPTMQAAQLDTSQIPQVNAQQIGGFDALNFLLSGQGYDPATLARMNAQAVDSASREGANQAGSARLAAQQMGLAGPGGSGALLALTNQANRNAGANRQNALNQIAIQNAQQGMQNLTTGAGMELGRQSTNAAQANQIALQNAANLYSGMQQNVQNMQQANSTNTANQQQAQMARTGAQAGLTNSTSQDYMNQILNRSNQSDFANASNQVNNNLNNAQLQRQADMYNTGVSENRYGMGFNALANLASGANPAPYYGQAGTIGSSYQPNLIPAQTYQNTASQLQTAAKQV